MSEKAECRVFPSSSVLEFKVFQLSSFRPSSSFFLARNFKLLIAGTAVFPSLLISNFEKLGTENYIVIVPFTVCFCLSIVIKKPKKKQIDRDHHQP
jgi:hypothetical protein